MTTVKCKVLHATVGCEVEVDATIFEQFRQHVGSTGTLSEQYPPNIILADEGLVILTPFVREDGQIEAGVFYLVPSTDVEPGPLMEVWRAGREHGAYPSFAQVSAYYERATQKVISKRTLN